MTKPSERRQEARAYCLLVVRYRGRDDPSAAWRPASVLDFNEGGCRLRVAEQLAEGTVLELRFEALLHDGVKSSTIEAPARVMWCRKSGTASAEIGVKFDSLPPGLSEIRNALQSLP